MRATPDPVPFSPKPQPIPPFATRPDQPPPRQNQAPPQGSGGHPSRQTPMDYDDGAWM
jgi:hypothetical protein